VKKDNAKDAYEMLPTILGTLWYIVKHDNGFAKASGQKPYTKKDIVKVLTRIIKDYEDVLGHKEVKRLLREEGIYI
jgi:hypothetical protein